MSWAVTAGDSRAVLGTWPAGSVQTVVTSPPYFGLRSYGTDPQIWGGRDDCAHEWERQPARGPDSRNGKSSAAVGATAKKYAANLRDGAPLGGDMCRLCGAWFGELGSEPTVDSYVSHLVDVFRAVRRVLAPTGVLWLNIGDSYVSQGGHTKLGETSQRQGRSNIAAQHARKGVAPHAGLGDKQLLLIPARVALALQADGWVLRADVIWAKPNCMPESVEDRPTKSHEHLFMFAKQARYFYDADALREPLAETTLARDQRAPRGRSQNGGGSVESLTGYDYSREGLGDMQSNPAGRNARDVWTIATEPYAGAHFAVMPTELARRCILAGTSAAGQCAACGAPWARVVERNVRPPAQTLTPKTAAKMERGFQGKTTGLNEPGWRKQPPSTTKTVGWAPTCRCAAGAPVPQVVADPFTGAGTVGKVAVELDRHFQGCDLNEEYCTMARNRIAAAVPYWQDARRTPAASDLGPLFNQPAQLAAELIRDPETREAYLDWATEKQKQEGAA